jgi:hypothetical protein
VTEGQDRALELAVTVSRDYAPGIIPVVILNFPVPMTFRTNPKRLIRIEMSALIGAMTRELNEGGSSYSEQLTNAFFESLEGMLVVNANGSNSTTAAPSCICADAVEQVHRSLSSYSGWVVRGPHPELKPFSTLSDIVFSPEDIRYHGDGMKRFSMEVVYSPTAGTFSGYVSINNQEESIVLGIARSFSKFSDAVEACEVLAASIFTVR